MNRAPSILIIDDDVDSALLIDSIFSYLGCETKCITNSIEAKKQIASRKADLIILDWILGPHTDAAGLVAQCAHTLQKVRGSNDFISKSKVITYSSLDESEIGDLANPFFDHVSHWQKPIDRRDLLQRALVLLKAISHQGGKI